MKRNFAMTANVFTALLVMGASTTASAHHKDFSIECEHTLFPSCCTAIHQSAGANAQYHWQASKGRMELQTTNYPWNWHHCGIAYGGVELNTSIDGGVAYGHGSAFCPSILGL